MPHPPRLLPLCALSLACQGAPEAPAPPPDRGDVARERGMQAARGAPVDEHPWSGPRTVAVFAADPASPGPAALGRALGATVSPMADWRPPVPGQVSVAWLPAGADPRSLQLPSGGGARVVALGPGEPGWRDGAVVALGHQGAGVVDSVASAARFAAADAGLAPTTAAAAAAWEIAHHYELALSSVEGLTGPLAVAMGAPPSADPLERAWAARRAPDPAAQTDPDPAVRLGALWAQPGVPSLTADSDPQVRARALDGVDDVGLLRAALDDGSSVVRLVAGDRLAALARGGSDSPALRSALAHAASLPDAYLRWKAAHGLGHLPGSVEALRPLLTDRDVDVRREAARALGRQRDPAAVPALEAALDDDNSFVRQWVARGLAALQHPDALPGLRRAAQDPSALVVEVAVQGARELGEPLPGRPYHPPRPGDTEALLALTKSADGIARKDALKHLAGTPEGTRAAIDALADPDSEVRKLAVESLGWSATPRPELLAALTDPDPDVLVTSLISLRRLPLPGSAEAVAAVLADPDPEVRMRAAQALAALAATNPEARAALEPVLQDPDERTRAAAVSAWPQRLSPDEPASLVRRASARAGGPPCDRAEADALVRPACPGADPDRAAASAGLWLLEDDLLHLRASWSSPADRPSSHRALRPPVGRPYGDPNRG